MRTTTHPKSIQPSPARAILYELSSKRDSPVATGRRVAERGCGYSLYRHGLWRKLDKGEVLARLVIQSGVTAKQSKHGPATVPKNGTWARKFARESSALLSR